MTGDWRSTQELWRKCENKVNLWHNLSPKYTSTTTLSKTEHNSNQIRSDILLHLSFLLLANSRETCVDCTQEFWYRPPGFFSLGKLILMQSHILHYLNKISFFFAHWRLKLVYLGVLLLQLATVVNDNFLSVRSSLGGWEGYLRQLVKWEPYLQMHWRWCLMALLLSMILRVISWGIYSPSRYR